MTKPIEDILHLNIETTVLTLGQIEDNAEMLGITLTRERWAAIHFVRDYLKKSGPGTLKSHEISQALKNNFYIEGGYKYMYELFPEGPVHTLCKLLNIELVDADEKQFGVIH